MRRCYKCGHGLRKLKLIFPDENDPYSFRIICKECLEKSDKNG